MSVKGVLFEDIIKVIQDGKRFYNNIHLDFKDFMKLKKLLDSTSTLLASTEEEKQDYLKKAKHVNLIFAFARKELNKCYKCLHVKDNIVCFDIVEYLSALSNYVSQLFGYSEKTYEGKETMQEVMNILTPSQEDETETKKSNIWDEEDA